METRRSMRERLMMGLIVIDLDYFKSYNDEHGHLSGDECLIKVRKAIQDYCRRPGDLAVRLGGDEFALLLTDTDLNKAYAIADSLRQTVYEMNLSISLSKRVTLSLGVASMIPESPESCGLMMIEADKALYRAKNIEGRNSVEPALFDSGRPTLIMHSRSQQASTPSTI